MKGKYKIMVILILFIILILLIIVYFLLPYSPVKSDFQKEIDGLVSDTATLNEVFTENDIENLPLPVKKYFKACGFIGTPKMCYMKAVHKDVDFLISANKPYSKIDYIQYNFVKNPERLAFIDTSIYGIPFQGIDGYTGGNGSMKGVLGKSFTLFNETGSEMNVSCLVTVLSECLLTPNIAIQDYISWESIDDYQAKATISFYGIYASGIFKFNEDGEAISFVTYDRWSVETNGSKAKVSWSISMEDYRVINGIKQPGRLKAIWHYKSGDSVYFDSKNPTIEFI